MPNPLYNMLTGGIRPAPMNGAPGMDEAISRLRSNPGEAIRNAGYFVPEEIANNPQAAVMHLLQTGQIGGPAMQRIRPMLDMLMGKR